MALLYSTVYVRTVHALQFSVMTACQTEQSKSQVLNWWNRKKFYTLLYSNCKSIFDDRVTVRYRKFYQEYGAGSVNKDTLPEVSTRKNLTKLGIRYQEECLFCRYFSAKILGVITFQFSKRLHCCHRILQNPPMSHYQSALLSHSPKAYILTFVRSSLRYSFTFYSGQSVKIRIRRAPESNGKRIRTQVDQSYPPKRKKFRNFTYKEFLEWAEGFSPGALMLFKKKTYMTLFNQKNY